VHCIQYLSYPSYNDTMPRFYNPRLGKENEPVDPRVGFRGRLQYDPQQDSGSSGSEVNDLHPERTYDTDLRRVEADERPDIESINDDQGRIKKFITAAKTANKFRQKASIDEPNIRGEVPRSEAVIGGVEVPSLGDEYGKVGSIGYAKKPQPNSGKFYGFG